MRSIQYIHMISAHRPRVHNTLYRSLVAASLGLLFIFPFLGEKRQTVFDFILFYFIRLGFFPLRLAA
jgi:hypothetical protein